MIGRRVLASIPARLREEKGITLAELLVTRTLLSVVLIIFVTVFAGYTRVFTEDRSVTTSSTTATIGMNEVTRVVRSGTENPISGATLNDPVFEFAGNEKLTLYAYLDTSSASPKPVKVQFSINPQRELIETRWNAYVSSPGYFAFYTTAASTRVVARKLLPHSGSDPWVFTFYKGDGTSKMLPVATGSLTLAERRQIVAVQIRMTVQADPTARADPVALQNTVGIPNLGVSRVGLGS